MTFSTFRKRKYLAGNFITAKIYQITHAESSEVTLKMNLLQEDLKKSCYRRCVILGSMRLSGDLSLSFSGLCYTLSHLLPKLLPVFTLAETGL